MKIYDTIIANGGVICYNSLASRLSFFKSGGAIDTMIEPKSYSGLVNSLELLNGVNYVIIGNCSNTLIDDFGYKGIILTTRYNTGYELTGDTISANCGENLSALSVVARRNLLSGMEELAMIPGTLGGAIYMNAGAFGRNIESIIDNVTVYVKGRGIHILTAQECQFGYRDSVFRHDNSMVILSARLKLQSKNKLLISNRMQELNYKRRISQPTLPSLGSVFKKIGAVSAGYYIEKAGLKGAVIGGAMISDIHANFIVNKGGATSSDYKGLVNLAQDKVMEDSGIELEREVLYL